MWKKLFVVASAVVIPSFANSAYGKALQCNKKQTRCLIQNTNLTIGDEIGVFNTDGQLVATGEVSAMRGERRAVKINERHGRIAKGYNLALLDKEKARQGGLNIYREPSKMTVGGSFGLSHVSIGEGSPATEFSGYAQWRKWGGMQLIGRAVYTVMEGSVSRYSDIDGIETQPISMSGIAALGGVGYVLREQKTLSFRGELGLGVMHVDAAINGSSQLVDDGQSGFNSRLQNGIAPYGRWSLGAVLNFKTWHVHADLVQSLVHEAFANTLAAGVSMDMK